MKTILYKAELRNLDSGKKIGFFFDGHLTGLGRFNLSGSKVLTALATGEINLWSVNGKIEKHLRAHHSMAKGIAMTMNNSIIASVAEDNKIILHNLVTNSIATIYFITPKEYIIFTNKGNYDYPSNNSSLLKLVFDGEIINTEVSSARINNLLTKFSNRL